MKFAVVCGKRIEATKGAKGICPSCRSDVFARCGDFKINHWAHKGNRNCDPWWENETEWHRSWKNHFPSEWQEISIQNELTDEKHIADVRTSYGLILEFQHSHIDPQERSIRERFYQNMIWIIDGTRLKRDYPRFTKGKNGFLRTDNQGIYLVDFPEESFPSNWLGSSAPVIYDFKGTELIGDPKDTRNHLYCLFPIKVRRYCVIAEIPRNAFINTINTGDWLKRTSNFMNKLIQKEQERQNQIADQQLKKNIRRTEPTHYYDPRKERLVKRWRF